MLHKAPSTTRWHACPLDLVGLPTAILLTYFRVMLLTIDFDLWKLQDGCNWRINDGEMKGCDNTRETGHPHQLTQVECKYTISTPTHSNAKDKVMDFKHSTITKERKVTRVVLPQSLRDVRVLRDSLPQISKRDGALVNPLGFFSYWRS